MSNTYDIACNTYDIACNNIHYILMTHTENIYHCVLLQ